LYSVPLLKHRTVNLYEIYTSRRSTLTHNPKGTERRDLIPRCNCSDKGFPYYFTAALASIHLSASVHCKRSFLSFNISQGDTTHKGYIVRLRSCSTSEDGTSLTPYTSSDHPSPRELMDGTPNTSKSKRAYPRSFISDAEASTRLHNAPTHSSPKEKFQT